MLNEIQGNLFHSKDIVWAHQVNARSVMGSGIAKQIREEFPNVFEEYVNSRMKLGDCLVVPTIYKGKNIYIANLCGQKDFGREKRRYTDYGGLLKAMSKFFDWLNQNNINSFSTVRIGCGSGNGDWAIVKQMLQSFAQDNFTITVYNL